MASKGYADAVCGEIIKSGVASGKTEAEAKSAATTWWSSRAGALGEGYQEWKNAKNKALACHAGPFDTFKCRASAEPCRTDDGKPADLKSGKHL
ncbi:MAG: hypothetical protein JSR78_18115 [Proteobacteria bacterium]|nr:hypothetical protein [Pseudomonadota bacterium]